MQRKRDLIGRLGEKLDIPREVLPGGFLLSLSGKGELTVCGCADILAYSEQEILLSLGGQSVRVEGCELVCTAFCAQSITVCGKIGRISLEACHAH